MTTDDKDMDLQPVDTTAFKIGCISDPPSKHDGGELLQFGKTARVMCSWEANRHEAPREVFVVQLQEATAEWRRRHPRC